MEEYTLVRLADNIRDKAVLTYDVKADTITDSGIVAYDGELQAAAGTVKVGLQEMASEGEQVVWRNRGSGVAYSPPWHVVDEYNPGGSVDRYYGVPQVIERYSDKSGVVENPSFGISVGFDEIVLKVRLHAVEAHERAIYEIISLGGSVIWGQLLRLSVGDIEYTLDVPTAVRAGAYEVRIRDIDTGIPVRLLGNPQTGEPSYEVTVRAFTEKKLATQEYVQTELATAGEDSSTLMVKSVYDPDNDGSVRFADEIKGADMAEGNTFYGKDGDGALGFFPIIPSEAALSQLETEVNSKANAIEAITNRDSKTVTLHMLANGDIINTSVIDLASWFE